MWAVWLMIGMVIGSLLTSAMLAIVSIGRDEPEGSPMTEKPAYPADLVVSGHRPGGDCSYGPLALN
jgi:hypothetical protein